MFRLIPLTPFLASVNRPADVVIAADMTWIARRRFPDGLCPSIPAGARRDGVLVLDGQLVWVPGCLQARN